MEKKLSRIAMYNFAKSLCAVLFAISIGVTFIACDDGSKDPEIPPVVDPVDPTPTPEPTTEPTPIPDPVDPDPDPDPVDPEPTKDYADLSDADLTTLTGGYFSRHHFINPTDSTYNTSTEEGTNKQLAYAKDRIEAAKAFMEDKIEELAVLNQNDPNTLFDVESLRGTSFSSSLERGIEANYNKYSKFMGKMDYELARVDNNNKKLGGTYQNWGKKFNLLYQKLAVQAYADSIGNHKSWGFGTFTEETNDIDPALTDYYPEYAALDDNAKYDFAAQEMVNLLGNITGDKVAGMPNNVNTMVAGINLVLYNEGMYGIHDFVGHDYATITGNKQVANDFCLGKTRSLETFNNKIIDEVSNLYAYNLQRKKGVFLVQNKQPTDRQRV